MTPTSKELTLISFKDLRRPLRLFSSIILPVLSINRQRYLIVLYFYKYISTNIDFHVTAVSGGFFDGVGVLENQPSARGQLLC